MVNSYRKVSINNLELRVPGAPLHERIQLRITPDKESGLSEVRFWHEDKFLGSQKVKNSELNLVHFYLLTNKLLKDCFFVSHPKLPNIPLLLSTV